MPSIEALSPVFNLDPRGDRICTHVHGQRNLAQLGARLAGTPDLVGLYAMPEAEAGYRPDPAQAGRVVALVRLLPMPQGQTMQNYASGCTGNGDQHAQDPWPFGWPSETLFHSPTGGPVLQSAVALVLGVFNFADFLSGFQHGPVDLHLMPALQHRLMNEIEHEAARNPATRLLAF